MHVTLLDVIELATYTIRTFQLARVSYSFFCGILLFLADSLKHFLSITVSVLFSVMLNLSVVTPGPINSEPPAVLKN